MNFSQPVAVDKNTTYVASYFAPNGHYSEDGSYFYTTPPMGPNPTITNVDSPPLHALRNTNGVVNGVFSYSGSQRLPDQLSRCFQLLGRPRVLPGQHPGCAPTGVTATAGNGSAT